MRKGRFLPGISGTRSGDRPDEIFRSPSGMSNGIKFDAAGNMIVCEGADYGGRRVTRTDMKTGKSWIIAGMFEGRPFNSPNDVTIDEKAGFISAIRAISGMNRSISR